MRWDKSIICLATGLVAFAVATPTLLKADTPVEQAAIEHDWRMQDGIGTPRAPSTYSAAVERLLGRGDRLLADLQGAGVPLAAESAEWQRLRALRNDLSATKETDEAEWEVLWRRTHVLRRRIALANPLAKTGPLVFIKQIPGIFSHQLTQYYGSCARPGGGVFLLERPGESMQCRQLATGALPPGSYQHMDVSWDGGRILFAHCCAETAPFWSDELGAIADKHEQLKGIRHHLNIKSKDYPNADGHMTEEQKNEYLKKREAELISPAEVALWKRGASNAGYHYLGCAKTFALMGRNFAEANLKMLESQRP
jgi:hypothetical protein